MKGGLTFKEQLKKDRMANKIYSIENLLDQLNCIKERLCGKDCHSFTMKQLKYHAYDTKHKHYIEFDIPKKDKKSVRTINAPVKGLKIIQKCIGRMLSEMYTPNPCAMGFVEGKSVVSNAKVHLGQNYVYNIDLENFFPSITGGRLYKRLHVKPFCFSSEVAGLITQLCCCKNTDGVDVLPQGAPTSPIITNIICERLDRKLQRLAQSYDLKYSRYADDITFSGVNNKFDPEGKFCVALKHIIEEEEHFKIKQSKTRLRSRNQRQEVTGLTVNDHSNVSKKYVKEIRCMIQNWEKGGYDYAQQVLIEHYPAAKNIKAIPRIENVLMGKLEYLKMVKGDSDRTYLKLYERYAILHPHIKNRLQIPVGISRAPGNVDINTLVSDIDNYLNK